VPRWDDIGIGEMLDLWVGWSPPTKGEPSSGQTWDGFLNHWAAVREEALPKWEAKRVEMRAHYRTQVAHYAEELRRAPEQDRDVYEELLAWMEQKLEEEEAKSLPFAELAYQRALAGKPDGSDDEDDEEDWR